MPTKSNVKMEDRRKRIQASNVKWNEYVLITGQVCFVPLTIKEMFNLLVAHKHPDFMYSYTQLTVDSRGRSPEEQVLNGFYNSLTKDITVVKGWKWVEGKRTVAYFRPIPGRGLPKGFILSEEEKRSNPRKTGKRPEPVYGEAVDVEVATNLHPSAVFPKVSRVK